MAFLVGASAPLAIQHLAVPFASLIIAFLGYGSQYLFAISPDLAPGPLTQGEKLWFNGLLLCLWWTYFRACSVDPGRYTFPPQQKPSDKQQKENTAASRADSNQATAAAGGDDDDESSSEEDVAENDGTNKDNSTIDKEKTTTTRTAGRKRWCKKCRRPKPPRAHHCKTCARCIPRMDHHCPWTANCVSLQTLPHFLRFLVYTNLSLWTLLYHLAARFRALWDHRLLPAYLGPTLAQLIWLTVLAFVAGIASLALGIVLIGALKGWLFNTTMIEGWEIERHEAVLERRGRGNKQDDDEDDSFWGDSRREGRGLALPGDAIEFPYDVGFWHNLCAGMGTRNFLLWFWPFAGHPQIARNLDSAGVMTTTTRLRGTGWEYEENGLNDAEDMWPPLDPAKTRHAQVWRQRRRQLEEERERFESAENGGGRWARPEDQREAFRRRQQQDLRRWQGRASSLGELEELPSLDGDEGYDFVDEAYGPGGVGRGIVVDEGKQGWVNAEGEHLGDYGVDEDAEYDEPGDDAEDVIFDQGDDEDVPLCELVRRRKFVTKDSREL